MSFDPCPHCGSDDAPNYLGRLGTRDHFRCVDCGGDFSETAEDLEEDDIDDLEERDLYDDSMDGDHDSAMASAGWGIDEDYGGYSDIEEY